MMRRKVYGQSENTICAFCGKQATTRNTERVPVCKDHRSAKLEEVKCTCGRFMDVKEGKWGPFFVCPACGPVSFEKARERNRELNR
ncbi:MAG: hypothetical protein ACMXYM_00520 [Candidatus Woesearchaeota archaeon]